MKKASLVLYNNTNPNYFFKEPNNELSDDWQQSWRKLKEDFKSLGIDLDTTDKNPINESSLILFYDFPPKQYLKSENQIWVLFLMEPKSIYPINYDKEKHALFDFVFTWDPDFLVNKKYHLLPLSHNLKFNKEVITKEREFHAVIIAGFKKIFYKYELYSLRFKIIKWFSENQPQLLHHYGRGWPKELRNVFLRQGIENRLPNLMKRGLKILHKKNKVYKGEIDLKREVLTNYKFSFVIENSYDQKGYVTEKIFDSFVCFSIPIYKGAPNIKELIPSDTFILLDDFKNIESLNDYLNSMSKEKIEKYKENILNFLESESSTFFRSNNFSNRIISILKNDKKSKHLFK